MLINIDRKGVHFHFSHGQFYLIVIIVAIIIGVFSYQYYIANHYDSSLNGSEIKELQQSKIPLDVLQELKRGKTQTKQQSLISVSVEEKKLPEKVRIPILMYHYVEYVEDKDDKTRMSLNTTPYILEQQVKTLSDAGYTFITAGDLADIMDGKIQTPQKPIILTFDDGYEDFYTDVYPILKRYNAKATIYVIAGFNDNRNHLRTGQLQGIVKDGLVEVGAHTVRHSWLKGRFLKEVSSEVFQSRLMLEKVIQRQVISFAYPFGAFDQQALQVVKNAGFRTAMSTIPGIEQTQENRFFLYRLRPGVRLGKTLLGWLDQNNFTSY